MKTKRKYDPVKRREYYLKTRQLKGRKPGKAKTLPKSNWINDLAYSTKVGLENRDAYNKTAAGKKERVLRLEERMTFAGELRKELKTNKELRKQLESELGDQGFVDADIDKHLMIAQYEAALQYFNVPQNADRTKARMGRDLYGNIIGIPPGVTDKQMLEFMVTAKNDLIPNIKVQNPIKKFDLKNLDIDLQSPLKKGKDQTFKVGVDPTGKPAKKAPAGYQAPKPAPRAEWPWKKKPKDQVTDLRNR